MAVTLNDKHLQKFIAEDEMVGMAGMVAAAHSDISEKKGLGFDYLGWVDLPVTYDREEFARILAAAEKIRRSCDVLIVIGIGGSYLGARAAIEFVKSPMYNQLSKDTPDIYFAGNNISAQAVSDLLQICQDKDVCLNVISKSGTTTEPAVAFRIFRDFLTHKYGPDAVRDRVYITTDRSRGTLKQFADAAGCETFVVPDDCGGRYSVLTAVGLLPIACAGIDIDKLMQGAADAHAAYADPDIEKNDCYKFAAIRNIMLRKSRTTEITVAYEPYMWCFGEWIKQLFGESEGKDGKGLFPASMIFSTDLHSLGQYVQQGLRNMYESVIWVRNAKQDQEIPFEDSNADGLNFVAGKNMQFVNEKAFQGTVLAHAQGGVPSVVIELDEMNEFTMGQLIYFYEKACGISAYVLGVNPFDQPGVQMYKSNMFALLGKPGYEDKKAELENLL